MTINFSTARAARVFEAAEGVGPEPWSVSDGFVDADARLAEIAADAEWERRFEACRARLAQSAEPGPLAACMDGKVSCAECGAVLRAGEIVRDIPIFWPYEDELEYIEIAHAFRVDCYGGSRH